MADATAAASSPTAAATEEPAAAADNVASRVVLEEGVAEVDGAEEITKLEI